MFVILYVRLWISQRRKKIGALNFACVVSWMSFSHFGELWLAESHCGGNTSGKYAAPNWMQATAPGKAPWGFGIGCRGSVGQSELGAAVLLKAVWWDLRLASLLTHLLFFKLCISRVLTHIMKRIGTLYPELCDKKAVLSQESTARCGTLVLKV